MLVCHCNGISDRTIRRVIRGGANSLGEVRSACGAGGCCQSCTPAIRKLLRLETAQTERDADTSDRPQSAASA